MPGVQVVSQPVRARKYCENQAWAFPCGRGQGFAYQRVQLVIRPRHVVRHASPEGAGDGQPDASRVQAADEGAAERHGVRLEIKEAHDLPRYVGEHTTLVTAVAAHVVPAAPPVSVVVARVEPANARHVEGTRETAG